MSTLFTRASAARKVIRLFEDEYGITRGELSCDARLDADLGVSGIDAWDLLEEMHCKLGVDMTEFDCEDYICPEHQAELVLLVIALVSTGLVVFSLLGHLSFLITIPLWLILSWKGASVLIEMCHLPKWEGDLRVRDLVVSVEAGRWVSPKKGL